MNALRLTVLLFAGICMLSLVSCAPQISEGRHEPSQEFTLPEINHATNATTVVNVIDGVTLEVDIGGNVHIVKYLGVELPDAVDSASSSIYRQALEFNRFLVEGKSVQLAEGPVDTDARGNLLRYVYVDGQMANEALITNGYAKVADFPQWFEFQTDFLLAEENAKSNLRGFWNISQNSESSAPQQQAPLPEKPRFGGTLPNLPSSPSQTKVCDFSGTPDPLIKGVTNPSGEQLYYLPNNPLYSSIDLDTSKGDKLFCTEFDAMLAGLVEAD